MLETPNSELSAVSAASIATVKRYAPPSQRNRSLGRRKSGGDRLEWANSYVNDGQRNPIGANKSGPTADHGDAGGNSRVNETLRVKSIALHGCSDGEASQLLRNRWAAAVNAHNSLPEDSAERPVLYARKTASAWGRAFLPHMLIQPTGGDSQRDFVSELRQAMQNANSGFNV